MYSLTQKGISESEKIDTDKISIMQSAKITVYLGVVNDKNQVLIYTRKKHPFFDCQGFGGGRVGYGENIVDAAMRELKEETGLDGDPELIKILHNKLYDKNTGDIVVDKIMFFFKFTNPKGELNCSEEGLYEWVDLEDLPKYIKKAFDSKEEFLKQVDYMVNWDGKVVLEEQDEVTENY
jgi:8-oxo-dGTP pyrophosphatase MutT (NUDIX family)